MDDFEKLTQKVLDMEKQLNTLIKSDRYTIQKDIEILKERNIILDTDKGTKIGTSALQKLGFFDTTPVVQPSAIAEAGAVSGSYVQAEVQEIADQLNDLIRDWKEVGLGAT